MKKSYKPGTNVNIEIIFTFFEMRRMLKSRNIVEFKKSKLLQIKIILKVALISGHTVYKREVFVSLFVCLLPFGAKTTGWISTKVGLTLRRSSKNFFGGDPPRGGIILEKQKKKTFPY